MWEKPNQINYAQIYFIRFTLKKLNNKVLNLKQCPSLNNRIQALKNKLGHVFFFFGGGGGGVRGLGDGAKGSGVFGSQ